MKHPATTGKFFRQKNSVHDHRMPQEMALLHLPIDKGVVQAVNYHPMPQPHPVIAVPGTCPPAGGTLTLALTTPWSREMTQTRIAALATVHPDELHQYVDACSTFVNQVPPEILVGNYTGHLAMHQETVVPVLRQVVRPMDTVLDFGCGVGRVTEVLTRLAKTVIGADLSWKSLSRAARIVPDAVFVAIPGEGSLPFPPETFDCVVSMICLQHIQFFPVRHRYCQSFHRVLRPRGRLVLQLNASDGGLCIHWFERGSPAEYTAPDVVCTEAEIIDYLEAIGFSVHRTWRTNADSQETSWNGVPRKTSSEWLWVFAEKAPHPDDPYVPGDL